MFENKDDSVDLTVGISLCKLFANIVELLEKSVKFQTKLSFSKTVFC